MRRELKEMGGEGEASSKETIAGKYCINILFLGDKETLTMTKKQQDCIVHKSFLFKWLQSAFASLKYSKRVEVFVSKRPASK